MTSNSSDGSIYTAALGHSADPAGMLQGFWLNVGNDIRKMGPEDFKASELPLARIKKIMKLDEDVKMISAEAPVLFSKAAEIFVAELTLRAWIHTEDNKRRTLQRNDIAMAITKYDQFDFLIDIVPREELKPTKPSEPAKTSMLPEQVQYYFQLAQQQQQQAAQQQQQQQQQQQVVQTTVSQASQQIQVQGLQGNQLLQQAVQQVQQSPQQALTLSAPSSGDGTNQSPQQIILQSPQTSTPAPQVFQQVVSANGEVQNIPIQLTAAQLQAIQAQMQGKQINQPMVIQTGAEQQQQVQFVQQSVYQLPNQQQLFIQPDGSTTDSSINQPDDDTSNT